MKRRSLPLVASIVVLLIAGAVPPRTSSEELPGTEPAPADLEEQALPVDRTPPRLSHIDGEASFWLEGAASNSQLALDNDEAGYRQFRLTSGQASVDLRGMRTGQTVEVDTPNGAFTIDHNGYYRVEVDEDATRFTTRRGGRAVVTPANGDPEEVSPSEEIVVRGDEVESYAASDPDAWDRWNYQRSDQVIEAVSYRHVPDAVYGVDDLDHNGRWREVPRYGSVWFPSSVAVGWAPYTAGRWMLDPYYGWTWIDDSPWGWAPFHYGRWVFIGDYWGWAPGPIVARPYYAPALVAFFSAGPFSIGVGFGTPQLGWTPLGWGEPCRPWWGPARFAGQPRWFGWGGPRVTINQTVINNVNVYQNAHARNGLVVVDRNAFGRGSVSSARIASARMDRFSPVQGALPVRSDPARVVGGAERGQRPPKEMLERRVVATREGAAPSSGVFRRSVAPPNPSAQLVPSPREARTRGNLQRPRFGEQVGVERSAPPPPPRFEDARRRETGGRQQRAVASASSTAPRPPNDETASRGTRGSRGQQVDRSPELRSPAVTQQSRRGVDRPQAQLTPTRRSAPRAESPRAESPRAESLRTGRQLAARQPEAKQRGATRELPGQPADRVWAGRANAGPAAPKAAPQRAAQARAKHGESSAPRMSAQQPSAGSSDAQEDTDSSGRGHRER
ncbi:MAG: hypothetical protein NTZ61_15250 [Proteobacteria bacterium]|nr:hypothetical protein [Pseudomonadota bacterium]